MRGRINAYNLVVAISICALLMQCVYAAVPSCTPSTWLNVFVKEHLEFEANPNNPTEYYYSWNPGTATGHGDGTDPTYAVDAPATEGDTQVDVIITSQKAPACAAQICYGLHVYKCCPTAQTDYCTTDTPTFCWYGSCGTTAPFTPDSSIKFEWYVNDETTPISIEGCYSPNFETDPGYILPTKDEPVKTQTVTLKVLQDTSGAKYPHEPATIELYTCTLTFDLHWKPEGDIGVSKTFP